MSEYEKLRPWTQLDYCNCQSIERVLLVYKLHDNPLHCCECGGVIDPATLQLSEELVLDIARWHRAFGAIYDLWVDAGEYEAWAKQQLENKDGEINQKAIAIAKKLNEIIPTWYMWWQDPDEEEHLSCPNCDGPIDFDSPIGTGSCDACCIVT